MSPSVRTRILAVALVATAALATGCGLGGAAAVTASMESPPRPDAESPGEFEDEFGDEFGDVLPPGATLPDLSLPEGAEQLEECFQLTSAYTEVVVLTFSGDPEGRLSGLFDQLDAAAPDDVRDDLATVRRVTTEAVDSGLLDTTGALLSEEYTAANEVVIGWLSELCAGGG